MILILNYSMIALKFANSMITNVVHMLQLHHTVLALLISKQSSSLISNNPVTSSNISSYHI